VTAQQKTVNPAMLDLSNIQGNILRGYASFPHAHFLYLEIHSADDARLFLQRLLDTGSVTPGQWHKKPEAALNLAVTFDGLRALGLREESLATFPAEFQEGMKLRAEELGDVDESSPDYWDEPWKTGRVHILVMMYGTTAADLDARCLTLRQLLPPGVKELTRGQAAGRLRINGKLTPREHFGFVDGLSNPDVEGVPGDDGSRKPRDGAAKPEDVGNPDAEGRFRKIPVGEFILGYPGEGGEVAPMALPHLLTQDATYLVFRKLEQEVPRFHRYLEEQAKSFTRALPGGLPAGVSAQEFLAAKMMGRWQNGSSLIRYLDKPGSDTGNAFGYAGDPAGARCPLGAHVRRADPRDSLGFGGKTMSRHRLIRRGIPYGEYLEPGKQDGKRRGIIFLAFNSGFDQFEFVQQAWINFGDDFEQGNDTDPIAGSREAGSDSREGGRMMIPGDEATGRRPFICFDMPRFVQTRGGDYFFVPSLTGLRLLASGRVQVS
jgi:Dyp-type peroxidase family